MHAQLQTSRHRPADPHLTGQDLLAQTQINRIWAELANRIGAQKFEMWFAHTSLGMTATGLEIATDSPFVAKWIDSNFAAELRDVAEQLLDRPVKLEIRVTNSGAAQAHVAGKANGNRNNGSAPTKPLTLVPAAPALDGCPNGHRDQTSNRQGIAPAMNGNSLRPVNRKAALRKLGDFVIGACNRLAYSAATRLAEDPESRSISPLFIHGDCGVGKTHLLQGICQRVIEITGRTNHVRYVTGEQFTNEYIASIRNNTIEQFRQRIRKLELLAIDDVHFLSNKVRTQSEFLYTIDAIDLSGARVVLASDNHPHHIKRFNQALVSRFLSGMVVRIDRPDRETRIELIRRLAHARSLRINDAAIEIVAANCVGSVREIEGAITKLAAYRTLMDGDHHGDGHAGDEIGSVLAEKIFREQPWQPAQIVRLATIIDAVCTRLTVTKADLMGSSRHRRVVLARALVAYLGRALTTHSFPEIAQSLGRNNHSTIHTADQRLRKQLEANEPLDLGGADCNLNLRELADQLRRDVTDRK